MSFDVAKVRKTLDKLEKQLRQIPALKKLQKTIQIPIIYALAGAVVAVLILLYVFSGARAITNLVAFVYPAWMTVKALNSENKDDDTLWLAYWFFYGLFTLIESITDLFLFWVPMYELLKMIFIIYLYAPQVQGALFLYTKFVQPWVVKLESYEKKVSSSLDGVKSVFNQASAASKTTGGSSSSSSKKSS